MAIKYLDAKRIRGTATERTAMTTESFPQTGWKEIGRTTLSSTSDSITVSSLPAKDNIMILTSTFASGAITGTLRLNGDSNNNYASRWSENGASEANENTNSKMVYEVSANNTSDRFGYSFISNISSKEKLCISHTATNGSGNGSGNVPDRREVVSKWANTSDAISSITLYNTESGDFASGSELVVLGRDNDEADSGTNFWQELKYTASSGVGNDYDSGTFTAKKYLMFIAHQITSGSGGIDGHGQVNGDTGSNYAKRESDNGDSDGTGTATQFSTGKSGGGAHDNYVTAYILNIANKEKQFIGEATGGTTGATAGSRRETGNKWANTSDQITSIQLKTGYSNNGFAAGSNIRVWGSN